MTDAQASPGHYARLGLAEIERGHDYDALQARGTQCVLEASVDGSGGATTGFTGTGKRAPFVQQCIDPKNGKVTEYRAAMPGADQWLLLVAGVDLRSGIWSRVLEDPVFVSAFERTFYVDGYDSRIFELKTRVP